MVVCNWESVCKTMSSQHSGSLVRENSALRARIICKLIFLVVFSLVVFNKNSETEIELFRLDINMSRKAICSSFSCSIVNLMCGSIELSVSWKLVIAFLFVMAKLSSTKRFQVLGGVVAEWIACSSITSMHKFATMALTGLPVAYPWICLYVMSL